MTTTTTSRALLKAALPHRARRAAWAGRERLAELQQQAFERRLGGVQTGGHLYLDDIGEDPADRGFYERCHWLPVRRALKRLDPGPSDVFVDLGSGKGQALLIAGLMPYGRVVGVDLVDELTQAAQRNIARARPRLVANEVEAVTADVLEWEVPDDLSVLFLYSPFMGEIFHRALERIFESYDRRPRPLHIVYDFPWEHNWLVSTGRVVVEDVAPAQWPAPPWWYRTGWALVTYRVVGRGEGGPGAPDLPRRPLRPRAAVERWSAPNDHVFRLTRDGETVMRSDKR